MGFAVVASEDFFPGEVFLVDDTHRTNSRLFSFSLGGSCGGRVERMELIEVKDRADRAVEMVEER